MTMEFKWDKEGSGDPRGMRSKESGTEGVSQKAEVVVRKSLRWKGLEHAHSHEWLMLDGRQGH